MLINEAITLTERLIKTGDKHKDYERVVDLNTTYRIFITGEGIAAKLIQFVQREDAVMFAQRVKLTRSTAPAVASSIRQPFNKVTRNDRIKKTIELKDKTRAAAVEEMVAGFYGSKRKKNRGLEYWMKTRFTEMQFIDPNAWVVVEWDAADEPGKPYQCRPFEVSAAEAHNFFVVNDEVKWLFVCQDIKIMALDGAVGTGGTGGVTATSPLQGAGVAMGSPIKKDGRRFTLYEETFTVVYEQIDPLYLRSIDYKFYPNEDLVKLNDVDYIRRIYEPKIGYVPAERIGYKRDEGTQGRTFVNPWHDALCFFDKSLKTVSELDLTMALHVFPQKLQYVQKCKGVPPGLDGTKGRGCNAGYEQGTQTACSVCKGAGVKLVTTTAQDAILIPMPDNKEELFNLNDILVYKSPPIELIEFQNKYSQQLKAETHQAVFNSQIFARKAGGGMTEGTTGTATEADFNMQSVYDALEPFTEKYSETWRGLVTLFAVIAGETKMENINVSHDFPADYKLKTGDILISERKTASESGAPAFLIETIDDDLAGIIYAGDQLGLLKYRVKRKFAPFSGKNEDEVALLMGSEYVPKLPKILYANFELIFKEIELEDPAFWMKAYKLQKDIVEAKVEEWATALEDESPTAQLPLFRPGSQPGGMEGGAGEENPGDNNPETNTDSNPAGNENTNV